MSEPTAIAKLRATGGIPLYDMNGYFVENGSAVLAAYDLATQRAEAAEAERDAFRQMSDGWKTHADSVVAELVTTRAERDALREDAAAFLGYVERQQCLHEETHRGGALWEICDMCGRKWADDEGGKPECSEPKEITRFRAALDAALAVQPTTEGM